MITEFFNKAKDNLSVAQLCFDKGFYDACANRAYYATFQAAVAALFHNGIKRDKLDHKWVQSQFNERLIKRQKLYPAKMKPYLMEMQLIRNTSDYEPQTVSRKDASEQMHRAEEVIRTIGKDIRL